MKIIALSFCSVIIPAFATNSSCPQSASQKASSVGCEALETNFTNVSRASLSAGSSLGAVSPETTSSGAIHVTVGELGSTAADALDVVTPAAGSSTTSSTSPTTAKAQASAASNSWMIPTQYLNQLAGESQGTSGSSLPTVPGTIPSGGTEPEGSLPVPTFVLQPQGSLGSWIIPAAYLESLGVTVNMGSDPFDPGGATPEANSIALIGSGLIFLSLIAGFTRKKHLKKSGA
jgi:hypothetical protein